MTKNKDPLVKRRIRPTTRRSTPNKDPFDSIDLILDEETGTPKLIDFFPDASREALDKRCQHPLRKILDAIPTAADQEFKRLWKDGVSKLYQLQLAVYDSWALENTEKLNPTKRLKESIQHNKEKIENIGVTNDPDALRWSAKLKQAVNHDEGILQRREQMKEKVDKLPRQFTETINRLVFDVCCYLMERGVSRKDSFQLCQQLFSALFGSKLTAGAIEQRYMFTEKQMIDKGQLHLCASYDDLGKRRKATKYYEGEWLCAECECRMQELKDEGYLSSN